MQVDNNKGGLNELLAAMLNSKNKYIPKNELVHLLHRIEDDATEIYHTKYGSDGNITVILILMRKTWTLRLWDGKVLNRLNVLEYRLRKTYI
jgi:hypothetical protein